MFVAVVVVVVVVVVVFVTVDLGAPLARGSSPAYVGIVDKAVVATVKNKTLCKDFFISNLQFMFKYCNSKHTENKLTLSKNQKYFR